MRKYKSILTGYIEAALSHAEYDKLEDQSYSGKINGCPGIIAFGSTLRECEVELQSTLEEWILLGIKMGHTLPVIDGYNLNEEPARESMAAV